MLDGLRNYFRIYPDSYFEFRCVLQIFLDNQDTYYRGIEICALSKLQSGTVYPLLARMHAYEWLELKTVTPPEFIATNMKLCLYKIAEDSVSQGKEFILGMDSEQGLSDDMVPDFI